MVDQPGSVRSSTPSATASGGIRHGLVLRLVRIWCYLRHPRLIKRFHGRLRRFPDPALPADVHEKYLWRKIFDHNPLFTRVSDKLLAKEYAEEQCPDLRVPRTLWVGDDPARLPASLLLGDAVVKATHGSAWNLFIRGGEVDREELERRARGWLTRRYGRRDGEWAYRGVTPRLFVEEMLVPARGPKPDEYKCYVASGRVSYVYSRQYGQGPGLTEVVLDREGRAYATMVDHRTVTTPIATPAPYGRIISLAEKLGAPFDDIRCDLYDVDGEIYFSELTVYSLAGYALIGEESLMHLRDRLWNLDRSWFLTTPQKGWRRVYANALRARLAGSPGQEDRT